MYHTLYISVAYIKRVGPRGAKWTGRGEPVSKSVKLILQGTVDEREVVKTRSGHKLMQYETNLNIHFDHEEISIMTKLRNSRL